MKTTPEEKALAERLQASRFSGEGFLGNDPRSLDEIVAEDRRTLERLGLSRKQMLAVLRDTFEQARAALGSEIEPLPGLTAVAHEAMGRIPSPFRGAGVFEKGDVEVTDRATGETLVITRLGLALIEKHGFFQGHGSRYRLDPQQVAEVFKLD